MTSADAGFSPGLHPEPVGDVASEPPSVFVVDQFDFFDTETAYFSPGDEPAPASRSGAAGLVVSTRGSSGHDTSVGICN